MVQNINELLSPDAVWFPYLEESKFPRSAGIESFLKILWDNKIEVPKVPLKYVISRRSRSFGIAEINQEEISQRIAETYVVARHYAEKMFLDPEKCFFCFTAQPIMIGKTVVDVYMEISIYKIIAA